MVTFLQFLNDTEEKLGRKVSHQEFTFLHDTYKRHLDEQKIKI